MRRICSWLLAGPLLALGAAGAWAIQPGEIQVHVDVLDHLIGPRPVVRSPWRDLTTQAGADGWWFRLQVDATGAVRAAKLLAGPQARRQEAAKAARQLQFRPFEVGGKPVAVQRNFLIHAETEDYIGPPDRSFPAQVDPAQVRIALRRTTCYGSCPSYWVEVRGDGWVTYRGDDYVVVSGTHRWKIAPSAAAQLVEAFRKADYFHLQGHYVADATDLPTYVTRVSVGRQQKFVFNYGGGLSFEGLAPGAEATAGPRMPEAVTALEAAIDALSGVQSWVRGDGSTMTRLRDAKWNFRSRAAGVGLNQLVMDCQVELAKDFIRAGAPVDVKDEPFDDPALARSARCGDVGLVQMLAARGAFASRALAQALLASAVWNGRPEFVQLALKHRADSRRAGDDGKPFIFAVARTRTLDADAPPGDARIDFGDVVRLLVAAGADPNARDREGNVPLHEVDNADVVRALVRAGADPNARNREGETPLFRRYGLKVAPALVETGADINARDHRGRTALFGQTDQGMALALMALGVDVNARDHDGDTALETTMDEGVALALLEGGAALPADPARLSALIDKAAAQSWDRLRPVLVAAAGARQGKSADPPAPGR